MGKPTSTRAKAGAALIGLALVLVVWTAVTWRTENEHIQERRGADVYESAITGDPPLNIQPTRTGQIAAGATAAVLVLAGVMVLAVDGATKRPG